MFQIFGISSDITKIFFVFPRSDLHKNWSGGTLGHPKHAPTEISILVYLHLYHYGTRSLKLSSKKFGWFEKCLNFITVFKDVLIETQTRKLFINTISTIIFRIKQTRSVYLLSFSLKNDYKFGKTASIHRYIPCAA